MKKSYFKAILLAGLLASCEKDDAPDVIDGQNPNLPEPVETASVVLNEVEFLGNRVEIYNNGDSTVDLNGYFLCLGPGAYSQIGSLEGVGNKTLPAGEFLVVEYDLPEASGGLGLYKNDTGFGDAANMADFVQWGAAGAARENVAVTAGLWSAGEFVAVSDDAANSIVFDGEGNGASNWAETTTTTYGAENSLTAPVAIATTTFNVTISNITNYLNVHAFTTPSGATGPGPLTTNGAYYEITFDAVPGTKFTPVTMMGNSNDWFLAPTDLEGIDLWENGEALNNVDIAGRLSLYDSGTEADGDPSTFPPAGANVGPADENNLVRSVENGNTGTDYMTAMLYYAEGDGNSAGQFTFRITATNVDNFVITPGLAVLHVLPEPLFTIGEQDRGVGLEGIAEDGQPGALYDWFKETGMSGSPLRLASSLSVFSPGLVYAFNSESDPLVLQGEANNAANGLEELAEDGNNAIAVEYLSGMGIPVAASNEQMPAGPGQDLTFTIEVPQGEGYKFGFATMFVASNDWFLAYNNAGFPLFDEDGNAVSGLGASTKSYMYDSGTEVDEAVGFGLNQAPRQSGPNTGAIDGNNIVRRVSDLEDVQFGKGVYTNGPGTIHIGDPRGGYNIIEIDIQPQ